MEKEAAIAVWTRLEKEECSDDEIGEGPAFNVRLDATIESNGLRDYRVRVTGNPKDLGAEWWGEVIDAASESSAIHFHLRNNGVEIS